MKLYCARIGPTSEYAFGARNGGEWMREYRTFRLFFKVPADFSKTEQALLDALDKFNWLVSKLPALSVSAFVPATAQSESWRLTSQKQFEKHIENSLAARVIGSQGRIDAHDLCAMAEKEAQRLSEKFQRNVSRRTVITKAVAPQFVRLEVHRPDYMKLFEGNEAERPYRDSDLKWGVKTYLSSVTMCDLKVSTTTSMSPHPKFSDSMFEVVYASEIGRGYFVTRQPLSDAKRERAAAIQNARTMLLTYFGIEQMCKECQVDYPIDR